VKIIDVIDPMEEMPTRKIINDLAAWDPKFTWIDSVLFYMIGRSSVYRHEGACRDAGRQEMGMLLGSSSKCCGN
jgi:hypothetical protein